MITTQKTPKELQKILREDGLDACLQNLHCLDKGYQTQARHLILDFAERALMFVPEGEGCPQQVIKTARLYLEDKATPGDLNKAKEAVRVAVIRSTRSDVYFAANWAADFADVYWAAYAAAERKQQKEELKEVLKSMVNKEVTK